jgi:hypothetical protein
MRSNENKMSDGGRERASLGLKVRKLSQKWNVQRSAVRSIAWLDVILSYGCLNLPEIYVDALNVFPLDVKIVSTWCEEHDGRIVHPRYLQNW